jgi:hypothetical protein
MAKPINEARLVRARRRWEFGTAPSRRNLIIMIILFALDIDDQELINENILP